MLYVVNCMWFVACLIGFVSGIVVLIAAFRVSVAWGLASLFIPFGIIVFIVKYPEEVGGWGGTVIFAMVLQFVTMGVAYGVVESMSGVERAQYVLDTAGNHKDEVAADLRRRGFIVDNGKVREPDKKDIRQRVRSRPAPRQETRPNASIHPQPPRFGGATRPPAASRPDVPNEAAQADELARERERIARERRELEEERRRFERDQQLAARRIREEKRMQAQARDQAAKEQAAPDDYEPPPAGLAVGPTPTEIPETWTADAESLGDLDAAVHIGPYTIRPPRAMLRNVVNDTNAMFSRSDASVKIFLKPRKEEDGDWPVLLVESEGKGRIGERNYCNAMKRKFEYGHLNNMNFARIGDPPGTRNRTSFTYVTIDGEYFVEIKVEYRQTAQELFPALLASVHTFERVGGGPGE